MLIILTQEKLLKVLIILNYFMRFIIFIKKLKAPWPVTPRDICGVQI